MAKVELKPHTFLVAVTISSSLEPLSFLLNHFLRFCKPKFLHPYLNAYVHMRTHTQFCFFLARKHAQLCFYFDILFYWWDVS